MNIHTINEPEIKIKGGSIRASKQVDRSEIPALQARERVLSVLRAHDPDSRRLAMSKLLESDQAMMRVIAQEGAASNVEPAVRYAAIAALASTAAAESLNLLVDLAHFGEDFYVRSHAVLALGASGMHVALPAIAGHLTAAERIERSAARKAVELIVRKTSVESVKAHASLLDRESEAEVIRILGGLGLPRRRGEVRRTPQRAEGRE